MSQQKISKEDIESLGFKVTNEYEEACYKKGKFLLIPAGDSWQLAADFGEPASALTVINSKAQLLACLNEK